MFDQPERFAPWKRFLVGSILLVLVAATVTALIAFAERKDVTDVISKQTIKGLPKDLLPGPIGGAQTLLLIGSDERASDRKYGLKARSDTMMLVRLNPKKKVTTVLSIPRDLEVSLPGQSIAKFNASYSEGGAPLVVKTIKATTGISVTHVIIVNFKGFSQAIDKLGCVYIDVDRRYFNNNVGLYAGQQFATINIQPGYQKLCGPKALDYVRFRHFDSDILRAARQQSFLRQAKQQVGVVKLFTNANALKRIVSHNMRTDKGLANGANLQRLLKLGVTSAGKPVYQVSIPNLTFPTIGGGSYVAASHSSLMHAAHVFENGPSIRELGSSTSGTKKRHKKKKHHANALPKGMIYDQAEGKQQGLAASNGIKLPVYYPTVKVAGSVYQPARAYRLTEPGRKKQRASAYRIVVKTNGLGEYYGIQGVNWPDPPILANKSESRRVNGRLLDLYYEGSKLGLVAFHKNGASYWVENTLTRTLTDNQMLSIASTLRLRK